MPENALSPAFVKINYHSAFGTHVQTVPTVPYIPNVDPSTGGQFQLRGAALPTDADDAIREFCELQSVFYPFNSVFDSYTIYTQEDAEHAPVPRFTKALDIAGTISTPKWSKAVQFTWTFRTTEFGLFKLVMLDADTSNNFNLILAPTDAAYTDLISHITDDVSWISGRDGARPETLLQISVTLNDKLRKAYRMV